ncbi:MAG TPA: nucleoside phosphorylase [Armatimonadota bacterium]
MPADFPILPILEFDPNPAALLEPSRLVAPADVPEHCVFCFFREVIEGLREKRGAREVACLHSEMGRHPVYELEIDGKRLAVIHPGMGGPLAAGTLEECIALGCRKFIACGGAGVLDNSIAVGRAVLPTSAVRDEGTSYHYLPPSREVEPHPAALAALRAACAAARIPFVEGKTWTTDAVYRETPGKVAARRAEGCLTVEMEAASFFAVARFRGVVLGQILYGGDDVSGDEWDHRGWNRHGARETIFGLAAAACLRL